ncbi:MULTISPECIES: ComEC/Rec2 family competence protein [unclassified Ruminococcus]|uniref:ComEC/Rec2 family competence protein n=1 Tax=unclassified Ruminococcus TaxID=2608920 RepID=UPI00210D0B5C
MKRPLTVSGFALGAGAFAASLFELKITLFLCALCLAFFVLSLILKRLRNAVAALTLVSLAVGLALGGATLNSIHSNTAELLQKPEIQNAKFSSEEIIGSSRAIGQLALSNGEKSTVLVTGAKLKPYEVYIISGSLEEITGPYKNYYYSNGVGLQLYPTSISFTDRTNGNPLFIAAKKIQTACSDKLYSYLPQNEASIIDALLLGRKSALDSPVLNAFRESGAAHVAVVSGMHLSVISSIMYTLLYFLTKKRRLSSIVSILAVICFMLITGFTLSVVRAGIMCIIMLSGSLFNRRGDSLNSLGFAVLIITLFSPLSVLDIGFQLSVASTLGIVTLTPYFVDTCVKYIDNRVLEKLIITPVAMSVTAFLATAPIIAVNFNFIGAYFIVTNILLTLAVPALLIFSLLFVIFSFIPLCSFLSYPLGLISGLISRYIAAVVTGISSLPYAKLNLDLPYMKVIVGVLVLAAAVVIIIKRTKKSAFISGGCAVLAFSLIFSVFSIASTDNAALTLISTGGGITAVLEKNGDSAVIACGGTANRYSVQQALTDSDSTNLFTVKSGTKEGGGMFSIVRSSCISERYFIQDTSTNKQLLKTLDNATPYSGSQQIRLWDKYTLVLLPFEKSSAVILELEDEYILILPNPEYVSKLPDYYKKPSLLITTKPLDSNVIKADNTIIACSDKDDSLYSQQELYCDNTISLNQYRKISISINDKILYTKRGE